MYASGGDKCPGGRSRRGSDVPSARVPKPCRLGYTGGPPNWNAFYVDRVRTDRVRTDCVRTDPVRTDPVRTDRVRTDPVRTDRVPGRPREEQQPDAHRRSQGRRRRTPQHRDRLGPQGRPALPPRPRRGHARHRPRRTPLHPGVPAARPAQLRHRRGRRHGDRRRALRPRRRRRPHERPARRPVDHPPPPPPHRRARRLHLPRRRRPRQGQGRRPRPALRDCRRRRPAVDERRPDLRARRGRLGRRPGPSDRLAPPDRAPDRTVERHVREEQALLYRLSGDWNPCTPTRSSRPSPDSTGPSCTGSAPTG